MVTYSEQDEAFSLQSLKDEVAALKLWKNEVDQAGIDLLRAFGYMQWDGTRVRIDRSGIQVEAKSGEITAIYFPQNLNDSPATTYPYSTLFGSATGQIPDTYVGIQALEDASTIARALTLSYNGEPQFQVTTRESGAVVSYMSLKNGVLNLNENSPGQTYIVIGNLSADPSSPSDGAVWYNSTDEKLRGRINGVTVDLGGGGMSVIVKEADETVNNSAALQNDDELLFAVAANEVFQFEGVLNISTGATPDFRMTFTGPSGAVGSVSALYTDSAGAQDADSDVLGTALTLVSGAAGGTVRFWGGIHNGSNAGNCTLQWAQSTADASDTIVYAGSFLKYQLET